jgi:hypothetical protein
VRAQAIIQNLRETDDASPEEVRRPLDAIPAAPAGQTEHGQEEAEGLERYINQLPPDFDYDQVMRLIQSECSYCMDVPADNRAFRKWLKAHENLFPDVNLAMTVIKNNDSWCTDNDIDMTLFFERLGFAPENATCPRCEGTGEEPGVPPDIGDEGEELLPVCCQCNGSGTRVIDCECDEGHRANDTVCRWCWARGRRHWNDPAV